jgi:lipid A 3-O-deacylase
MPRLPLILATALTLAPLPALASDWVAGIGAADFSHSGSPTEPNLTLEYHAAPTWHPGHWSIGLGGALELDRAGDAWAGAGIAARYDFSQTWFIEMSEMPGLYHGAKTTTNLGGPIEFRTLFGVGYRFDNGYGISLAIDHRSNANLYSPNPGVNKVSLRLTRNF